MRLKFQVHIVLGTSQNIENEPSKRNRQKKNFFRSSKQQETQHQLEVLMHSINGIKSKLGLTNSKPTYSCT
jgi:hypothetical protein